MRIVRHLLLALLVLLISSVSFAQIGISVSFGPPALPVYEQPICPGDGYLWTPGYWAWDADFGDYYWVPGTWVQAPEVGYLWTPGWWGWGGSAFLFHQGYWGSQVGFYGGISYGFGYFGHGFEGGRWDGGHFFYNRAVNNVNVTNIHNTYNTVINHTTINRVSYNGGTGGISERASAQEEAAEHERHIPPVAAQTQHMETARSNPSLRASANHGKPPIAATARPAEFKGEGVVGAREAGAPYHPAPARPGAAGPANPTHASELQPHVAPAPFDSGNPKADQKYQQQQQNLIARQNQQHQQLQQRQEADHQRATQQNADAARQQQMEQRHQQQTQQLEQRHTEQQQRVQQRAPAPGRPEGRR